MGTSSIQNVHGVQPISGMFCATYFGDVPSGGSSQSECIFRVLYKLFLEMFSMNILKVSVFLKYCVNYFRDILDRRSYPEQIILPNGYINYKIGCIGKLSSGLRSR